MPTTEIAQAATTLAPADTIQYLILILIGGFFVTCAILGRAYIAKMKSTAGGQMEDGEFNGPERRKRPVCLVEANDGRFKHVEAMIQKLAEQVAAQSATIATLTSEVKNVQTQLADMLAFQKTLDQRIFEIATQNKN